MLFLNQRSRLKEDAIIGLIFSSFFGIGLFMVSLNPMSVNIQTIILGNIGDCAGRYSATGDHRRGFADHFVFEVERSDGGLF